jgi:hypothetical protein
MVSKHFMSFAVQNEWMKLQTLDPKMPIVVYANHSGWWDPIVAMMLRRKFFADRTFYAPIDADALANYRIMAQLGFYGLELDSLQGAADFLSITKRILETSHVSVWITPEGEFCDVRDHSKQLMPGLSHLAAKTPGVCFIPLAIEYAFWDESRPQIFTKLGAPLCTSLDPQLADRCKTKAEWNTLLTEHLRSTQSELARDVISRDASRFDYVIASRPARLGWYDYFRSWAAWLQGRDFDPRHSASKT